MGHKPFYVETKLDGERTQIHKEDERLAINEKFYNYYDTQRFTYLLLINSFWITHCSLIIFNVCSADCVE